MKKVWKWVGLIVFALVIAGAVFVFKLYSDVKATVDSLYTSISVEEENWLSDKRVEAVNVAEQHPFSALILGVDERKGDNGRSDTMILLTVNPTEGTSKMLSIPRDTYTEIVGMNKKDKINHAYAFGGMEMSVLTVEKLLDIPIDYVAKVNMEGFTEIVDFVGGVTVENTFEFSHGGKKFDEGSIFLNGEQALSYVRMRYSDPEGDFGRQKRQKQVIQEVIDKGLSLNNLFNYQAALEILKNNVEMNITFDEIQNIQRNYGNSLGNIEQLYFENGQDKQIGGIYYYIPDASELSKIQKTFQEHLGM